MTVGESGTERIGEVCIVVAARYHREGVAWTEQCTGTARHLQANSSCYSSQSSVAVATHPAACRFVGVSVFRLPMFSVDAALMVILAWCASRCDIVYRF